MTHEKSPRELAAERLARLAELEAQSRRRETAVAAAWRDPRHGQGRVLAELRHVAEATAGELAAKLGVSRQALAQLLAKLERRGLVERAPSPKDRRSLVVRLTASGRRAQQDAEHTKGSLESPLRVLDDQEVERFADYLGLVLDELDAESGPDERRSEQPETEQPESEQPGLARLHHQARRRDRRVESDDGPGEDDDETTSLAFRRRPGESRPPGFGFRE